MMADDSWLDEVKWMTFLATIARCKDRELMNCVLDHESALLRLYWDGDNLGEWDEVYYESCPLRGIDRSTCWPAVQRESCTTDASNWAGNNQSNKIFFITKGPLK